MRKKLDVNVEKPKVIVLAIVIFFFFSLLFAQFFNIQIVNGDYWSDLALQQHQIVIQEPFRRGAFYSNTTLKQGHPEKLQALVTDVTKFHLFIDPLAIPITYREEIQKVLAAHLSCKEDTKEVLYAAFDKKSRCRKVAAWLPRTTKEEIEVWWRGFAKKRKIAANALFFTTDYKRSYPFGSLLGQVLHTIRENKEENTHQGLPTGGLEAYFNDILKGKEGKRKIFRSPRNKLATTEELEPPENGADIFLTINHYIQAIAEEEIAAGVLASNAKGGWAVMMDPFSGEILALAQYPAFDPAHYQEYFNSPEKMDFAKIKSLSDAFELGSVMKPITVALCLKANEELEKLGKAPLFHPEEKIQTTQTIFPGRASKPLTDISPHKYLNMYMAIQKSSNIYMAIITDRLMNTLGPNWYRKELIETFGFGQKTGIELPAEAVGFLPTPGKKYPNGALQWSLPTPYSLAIGHNLLATSFQMLRAFAVFTNGGRLVNPTLVRKIVKTDRDGNEVVLLDKTEVDRESFKEVLSPEIAALIAKGMKYTTKEGGTGRLGDLYGYSEGGKSGTSEKIENGVYSRTKYISSFIGFTPANLEKTPTRFILLVSIDEPEAVIKKGGGKNYFGGRCAVPVFREIAKRTLEYLGVTPDDPFGYPSGDPRYNPERADWLQEVRALKMLNEEWNG